VLLTLGQRTEVCNADRGGDGKVTTPSNSAIRRDRNTIPVSTPMFSGVNLSMAPPETLSDETGSQKSKMAAEKTELNGAQLLYTIATKFQRLYPCFLSRVTRQTTPKTVRCADKGEIKDGCH